MEPSIFDLPNELLQQVILCLPARSLPNFQRTCRRFRDLVSPLIWRQLCRGTYRYWRPEHRIQDRLQGDIDATDWKALFVERQIVDQRTSRTIDSILASQMGRIDKFREILNHSYDAKDCLLEHCKTDAHAEDVLARRYYSHAVLGCIHRTLAIEEWAKVKNSDDVKLERTIRAFDALAIEERAKVKNSDDVKLERAIGAFDAFVLRDRSGDFDEITSTLDRLTRRVIERFPDVATYPTRQRAVVINRCLREMRIVGVYDELQENHPRNHFLGIALLSQEHSSLTLVSTVIYCCVAQRLGLDAIPGVFPFQVLAVVKPPPGTGLEGEPITADSELAMYLNPSAADEETRMDELIAQLLTIGVPRYSHEALLGASTLSELILRAARNIYHSVYENHAVVHARHGNGIHRAIDLARAFPDLEGSFYSALWALLLLGVPPDGDGPAVALRRRNYLPHIVEQFETNFPYDIDLIENYIVPLFQNTVEHVQLRESIRVVRSVDSMPKQVKTRRRAITQQVKYKVGQVFVHKRYDYQAVITGWDVECAAHENWIAQMRVHELSQGRQQSFYHVLVEDESVRYVAEENIEPIYPQCPRSLMPLAGRHFKRWDEQTRRFVSNIVDEYPDD